MKHSFLYILFKPQFSFPQKLGGIEGNGIFFNKIFTKTPKISLIFFLNIKLSLIPHLLLYIYIYIYVCVCVCVCVITKG